MNTYIAATDCFIGFILNNEATIIGQVSAGHTLTHIDDVVIYTASTESALQTLLNSKLK